MISLSASLAATQISSSYRTSTIQKMESCPFVEQVQAPPNSSLSGRPTRLRLDCVHTPKEQKDMAAQPGSLTFNTVITKLKAGQQIFSNTVVSPDLEAAKKACEGQDFIW